MKMKAQRVDLRPIRELIDNDFNGYNLSLDPRPVQKIAIKDVNVIKLKESQYSFQHIKSISLHSHLHQDPWDLDTVYYVNDDWAIMQVKGNQDLISEPHKVYEIPKSSRSPDGVCQFNVTLQFISEDYVVLTDGSGTLLFLSASNRPKGSIWQEHFSTSKCSSNKPFVLLHSIMQSSTIIDCLLLYIDERLAVVELSADDVNLPFVTVMEWVTFTLDNNAAWELTRMRRVAACGNVDYAALESSGKALCIVSEKHFKFIFDSENPVTNKTKNEDPPVKDKESLYAWSQTSDELTLWLKFDDKIVKSDIEYKLTSSHLHIGLKTGQALIEGFLFSTVDVEGSIWTWEGGRMEVILTKANPGLVWQELVKGDNNGQEILDANSILSVLEQLTKLSSANQISTSQEMLHGTFNPQQLEECDDFPVDSYKLVRIDDESHQVTHEVSLSSHQWLFSRVKLPNEYPVFCIRHDVDGLVWQPSNVLDWENHQSHWQCEHVATFNALGYVLASKQDKKFLSCSPECTFAALCDARLYLYLYFQPSSVESDLRNRKTGKQVKTVAKQQLVKLDTSNVLGLQVSNHNVFVLTEENLYIVNVVDR